MTGSSLAAASESRRIFALASDAYTMRDIVDAAVFRGDLQPVWEQLLHLRACEGQAEAEGRETDEAAIDTAAQTFRYDHDLITAEETENYLSERGLTLSDFGEYFNRHYWGEAIGDLARAERVDYFSAPEELRELLRAELLLSGELGRMADKLARRLAVSRQPEGGASLEAIEQERAAFMTRHKLDEGGVAGWLKDLGRDPDWLEEMLRIEATYGAKREDALTPEARKRELANLRFHLTVFDVEVIELDTQDAAREALCCVREDGMEMEEVAHEGRYPFRREQLLLEDIAPEVQQQFLSVIPGRVLEPIAHDDAWRLCRVMAKSEPNPDDPAVRRRIEQRLLDRHFADAVNQHVRWEMILS